MPFVASTDFLKWDASQTERYEFVDGKVFLREGAEDRHVTVCGNLGMALRPHLSCTPCRTYMSDMKLNVVSANQYFYPDVMVTCSAIDQANPLIKSEPKLIIEVLSPSTAALRPGPEIRLLPRDRELAGVRADRPGHPHHRLLTQRRRRPVGAAPVWQGRSGQASQR